MEMFLKCQGVKQKKSKKLRYLSVLVASTGVLTLFPYFITWL